MPLIGPAVAQFPALSQTFRLPIEAFAVSVPPGTLVVKVKRASDRLVSPDPLSLAVQTMLTSDACQSPSGVPHKMTGGVGSVCLAITNGLNEVVVAVMVSAAKFLVVSRISKPTDSFVEDLQVVEIRQADAQVPHLPHALFLSELSRNGWRIPDRP
jgi:hypothetical protein